MNRIVVAMSGGVDSSVVAALMIKEGFDVVGVTLQLRPCDDRMASRSCCSSDAVSQARAVAGSLGIPHYVLDCREAFTEKVLLPAWEAYTQGLTPSPCLNCNRDIKFGLLWEYAESLGASRIATGHYARLSHEPEGPVLMRGIDRAKDQSYFLSSLTADQLRRIELPLGAMSKSEVRALARELDLPTAERQESQDACLSYDGLGLAESLRIRFEQPAKLGTFQDTNGRVLGPHKGLHRYTIGQRRGLGIALGTRAHVVALRTDDGAVILSTETSDLLFPGLLATGVKWIAEPRDRCDIQIRSRHRAAPATLNSLEDGRVEVHFDQPQLYVTPGQAVAFYDGDRVLGGGWIAASIGERV
jgi:tRNA-specific 2-thiouridylase